jgi:hypothetical protein
MTPIGKITATRVGDDMVFADESGASYTIPGYAVETGLPPEIDPRIDLTEPIYDQVMTWAVGLGVDYLEERRAEGPLHG